jgi:hypothetical protein
MISLERRTARHDLGLLASSVKRPFGGPLSEVRMLATDLVEIKFEFFLLGRRPSSRAEGFKLLHKMPVAVSLQKFTIPGIVPSFRADPEIIRQLAIVAE